MTAGAIVRRSALAGAFALVLASCSSGDGATTAGATTDDGGSGDGGCAAAAELSGPIEDRGTGTAAGGAVTLDATEFAFTPTCVEAAAGETLEVTLTNTGSALHNLSMESLGIDQDVQAGETIAVEVTLPGEGSLPFVCKYHVAQGMQGAFLTG